MSVAILQFMKKIQFSGAAPPLILATSRHCFPSGYVTTISYEYFVKRMSGSCASNIQPNLVILILNWSKNTGYHLWTYDKLLRSY
jgi:hypothetical protein